MSELKQEIATRDELRTARCQPLAPGTPPLDAEQCGKYLELLEGWQMLHDGPRISRRFEFANFHETMAFVNALAWIAHVEDHHPDMALGYNYCQVNFNTHSIGGLSLNDFICVARIDALEP